MKIAFVSLMGGLPWGGSEALWHAVALHALEQKDEVYVSVYDWGNLHTKLQGLKDKGAIIHQRKRFNPDAGMYDKIIRFINKRQPVFDKDYQSIIDFNPEMVLISQGDSFDLALHHRPLYNLLIKNNIAYSLVCHNHEQFSFIPPKVIYPGAVEIFENAKQVFFVSKRQWKLTERRLVMKINNGYFTWNPLNILIQESPLTWPEGEKAQLGIVANISGGKGHDTALEVLSAPQWKDREWQLNIYGEGEGKKYLEDLAIYYGIKHNIVFHGHVADMIKVWETNHLLLIPSAGEGLPISLAEAMACGRAAVVTDVGGNTELITENETGFIAASPATEAFAAAMEKAWSEKDNWQQSGKNAFNRINAVLEKNPGEKIYELLRP